MITPVRTADWGLYRWKLYKRNVRGNHQTGIAIKKYSEIKRIKSELWKVKMPNLEDSMIFLEQKAMVN